MSIGGLTSHPASAKAFAKPAAPEKISQKHIAVNERIDSTNASQDAGHAGRSCPNRSELKDPRRVSSTREISSGLDWGVITCSQPESSLSSSDSRVGSTAGITIGRRPDELMEVDSTNPKWGSHAPGRGKTHPEDSMNMAT